MGSFVFKWDHPATEVFVTGTFDDWAKSVKLEKKSGNLHEKEVTLEKVDEKISYKFVVDGNWTTDHTAPAETDESGNTNNVLTPENITKNTGSSDLPGAFPETPAAGLEDVKVNPLPASAGIGNPITTKAGEGLPPQSSATSNSINDTVTLDKESHEKSGSASGAPQLPNIPNVMTPEAERDSSSGGLFGLPEKSKNTIPESSLPIAGGAGLNTVSSVGPQSTTAALAGDVPKEPRGVAQTEGEEGAPGSANIQSVGAGSTTAALAGEVPKEPRGKAQVIDDEPSANIQSVGAGSTTAALAGEIPLESSSVPEVVQESQKEAHASPEASANPEAVADKSAMEQELEKKVPEEPAATESTIGGKAAALAGGAAAGATAAVAGTAAYLQSGEATEDAKATIPEPIKEKLPESLKEQVATNGSTTAPATGSSTGPTPIASAVPDPVQESITKAHQAPEAASSASAVQEKSAVESELLKKIPAEQSTGEPAPEATETAATSAVAPQASLKSTAVPLEETKPETKADTSKSTATPIDFTPATTSKSTEAPITSTSKSTEVPVTETSKSSAAPATEDRESRPSAMASALSEQKNKQPDSRDISPMTRPDGTPAVTTGVGSSSTPKKSTPAAPGSPSSSKISESTDKKSKRRSGFFDKIKSIAHRKKDGKEGN